MATVLHGAKVFSTAAGPSYSTGAFTPAADDLLIAHVTVPGASAIPTFSANGGAITFTRITALDGNVEFFYIADSLATNVSMTGDVAGATNATGCACQVARVSGMSRTGSSAVKQSKRGAGAAVTTPEVVFDASVLTDNPTILFVKNTTNPATLTPPTGWTERDDDGFNTPTTGQEYVSRDSGFTGTTVTWGSTSASAWEAPGVELDTSVPGGTVGDGLVKGILLKRPSLAA